jgi:predicted murein hydrolase (TIGR00659 family)
MTANDFVESPLFGVATTCIAYGAWTLARRRWAWAHVMIGTCATLIALLLALRIPYASYSKGGDLISFFLGPATVALGVPLYVNAKRIRAHLPAIVIAVTAGSITGIASAGLVAWWLRASPEVLWAMVPKSVTTPISMELARQFGGSPQLAAVFTVTAGLIGSLIGPGLLRRVGVRHPIALGAAIGTSAHGLGTARLIHEAELPASVSALSLALAGIITSLLTLPLRWLLH